MTTDQPLVKSLFDSVPFDEVLAALRDSYVDIDGPSYLHAWEYIKALSPASGVESACIVKYCPPSEDGERGWFDVSGVGAGGESMAIEFEPWSSWLAMPVSVVGADLTPAQTLAHILWEMTFVSYDEDEIKDRLNDIMSMVEEIKADHGGRS